MNWMLFAPEMSLLLAVFVFLVMAWMPTAAARRSYLTALGLAALTVAVSLASVQLQGDLFYQAYRIDFFSQLFKVLLSVGYFLVIFLCEDLNGIRTRHHFEGYLLLAVCTLAMMLLVSSVHLLTIYVALELSSYSLYILVMLRREQGWGLAAGLRYFIIGACVSAVMLFGLALIYGVTQAAYLVDLMRMPAAMLTDPIVAVGLILALSGFLFKLALFPFHFWAPDAYEGAANQVTTYIATVSKVAAVAILLRMVAPIQDAGTILAHALAGLAIVSMTVGNLAAIVQKDFKRLMAFSSVAHAGYLLIGVLALTPEGYRGVVFYAMAVMVMKFTCFMVMVKVADDGRNMAIDDLVGLHRRAPLLAMALLLALFGLAGIPPTIGFTGKLLVFSAAMHKGYLVLVLIAMINVVISLYYYLLVLKAAYLTESESEKPPIQLSVPWQVLSLAMVALIVGLGFFPNPVIELAQSAILVLR